MTLTHTEMRMMDLARRTCVRSDWRRFKIGAVIARKSQVIGVGFNQRKTHPRSPNKYRHLHAEVDATLGVPIQDLRGATIYVYRERLDGKMGMSKPCPTCHAYLRGLGVSWAVYTTDHGFDCIQL